jgi:hypothetical protein
MKKSRSKKSAPSMEDYPSSETRALSDDQWQELVDKLLHIIEVQGKVIDAVASAADVLTEQQLNNNNDKDEDEDEDENDDEDEDEEKEDK